MNLYDLNFYGCTVEYNAIYIYIWLGIGRRDGPERHRMLTMINVYYGYYWIWLIHQYTQRKVKSSTF